MSSDCVGLFELGVVLLRRDWFMVKKTYHHLSTRHIIDSDLHQNQNYI